MRKWILALGAVGLIAGCQSTPSDRVYDETRDVAKERKDVVAELRDLREACEEMRADGLQPEEERVFNDVCTRIVE